MGYYSQSFCEQKAPEPIVLKAFIVFYCRETEISRITETGARTGKSRIKLKHPVVQELPLCCYLHSCFILSLSYLFSCSLSVLGISCFVTNYPKTYWLKEQLLSIPRDAVGSLGSAGQLFCFPWCWVGLQLSGGSDGQMGWNAQDNSCGGPLMLAVGREFR